MTKSRQSQPPSAWSARPDFALSVDMDQAIQAMVATVLRVRTGSDPTTQQLGDAMVHFKRFYQALGRERESPRKR